jgi:hypothetical protein
MNTLQELASQSLLSKNFVSIGRITIQAITIVSLAIMFFEVMPMSNTVYDITIPPSSSSSPSLSKITSVAKTGQVMISDGVRWNSDEHVMIVLYGFYIVNNDGDSGGNNGTAFATKKRSHSPNSNKKFVHSSIRIEQDVLKDLQKEAERRGVSFNSLVNKTLKTYVSSEMYFEQLGFILVSKDFLRKTFLKLDEKYIEEFGREIGLTVAKEYISYFSGYVNNYTLIQFLDIWFKRYQFSQHRIQDIVDTATSDTTDNERKWQKKQPQHHHHRLHSFNVIHDINMNFSLVLKAILEGLVEPITKSPVIFRDITAASITFSIEI